MPITISVIVAVYNAEKTLRRCLDSLVGQEWKNLDIILVDDGSTDSSRTICDEYASRDTRIRVVHKENEGVAATKQLGLDMATGDYFIYLDSDDYVDKTIYRKLAEKAQEDNADIVCCDVNRLEQDGMRMEPNRITSFKHRDFLEGMIDVLPGYMVNRMIRRTLVDKYQVRFPEGMSFGEDKAFLVDLLSKSLNAGEELTIVHIPEALYYYDIVSNPSSLMKLDVKPKLDARLRLWEAMGRNLDLKRFGKTYYWLLVKHGFTVFWNRDLLRDEFEERFSRHNKGICRYAPASGYTALVLMASSGKWSLAQKMRWLAAGRILSEKISIWLSNKQ